MILKIFIICLLFKLATSLTKIENRNLKKYYREYEDPSALSKVVRYIVGSNLHLMRRTLDDQKMAELSNLSKMLKSSLTKKDPKRILRKAADEHAVLEETELKNAMSSKKSALHDRPYIEKHGKNDFLVLRPEAIDPFVTVVPNHIYYDVEKSCVNWLDDCSLNGLRQRLLRGATF